MAMVTMLLNSIRMMEIHKTQLVFFALVMIKIPLSFQHSPSLQKTKWHTPLKQKA